MQEADLALLKRKNSDYGNNNILTTGIYGVGVRLQDKIARLLNLTKGNVVPEVKGESVEDTLADISNYGLIGRLLLEGQLGDSTTNTTTQPATSKQVLPQFRTNPNGRMVYLGGPVDFVSHTDAVSWRESLTEALMEHKWATYSPVGAIGNGYYGPGRVIEMCLSAINICDAMVAKLPDNTKAFGTIREIEYAKALGKPVIVWSPWADQSIFAYDLEVVGNQPDVVRWLENL